MTKYLFIYLLLLKSGWADGFEIGDCFLYFAFYARYRSFLLRNTGGFLHGLTLCKFDPNCWGREGEVICLQEEPVILFSHECGRNTGFTIC